MGSDGQGGARASRQGVRQRGLRERAAALRAAFAAGGAAAHAERAGRQVPWIRCQPARPNCDPHPHPDPRPSSDPHPHPDPRPHPHPHPTQVPSLSAADSSEGRASPRARRLGWRARSAASARRRRRCCARRSSRPRPSWSPAAPCRSLSATPKPGSP